MPGGRTSRPSISRPPSTWSRRRRRQCDGAPLMRREADDPADWTWPDGNEPPCEYTSLGWATPGHLWGYWGQLLGVVFDESTFIRLDNLVISDGWIVAPPL